MKPPKIIAFIEEHKLTPKNILLVCLSFWVTVIIVRGTIFWAVFHGIIPAIFVRGLHIHHFITGFLLLGISGILIAEHIRSKYIWLALSGCGMGLVFDEFIFWTTGHFNYWSLINLLAVTVIGTCIVVAYVYTKRYDIKLHHALGIKKGGPQLISALVPVMFVVFVLVMMFSYQSSLNYKTSEIQKNKELKTSIPEQYEIND